MSDSLLVAICSVCSNIVTILVGIKLIDYRVTQLEKKVEKHNAFYDKVNELEKSEEVNRVEHKTFDKRITNLEVLK